MGLDIYFGGGGWGKKREREHICSLRVLKEGKKEARLCEAILS